MCVYAKGFIRIPEVRTNTLDTHTRAYVANTEGKGGLMGSAMKSLIYEGVLGTLEM